MRALPVGAEPGRLLRGLAAVRRRRAGSVERIPRLLERVAHPGVHRDVQDGVRSAHREAARDTAGSTTPELLAEPQYIQRHAYDTVRDARYPIILPFDLWTETVRRFCDYFETPFWRVLEAFRAGDELFVAAQRYDRAAI